MDPLGAILGGSIKAIPDRYCILCQHGGIYLDFDSSISFALDSIPNDANELISYESNKLSSIISEDYTPDYLYLNAVTNRDPANIFFSNTALQWLLIFKREHPILLRVIELIEKNADFFINREFKSVHKAVCNFTGPVIFSVALHKYLDQGNKCITTGLDFNGLATFKDYSAEGVYANDTNYYATKENLPIYTQGKLLNLGCGEDIRPGYINVDANPKKPGVLKMELSSLGKHFEPESISEILAQDVLEHVGLPTALNWLKDWCGLLSVGGSLHIQTTCFELMVEALMLNKISPVELNFLLFSGVAWNNGASSWDTNETTIFDWHRCCFTKEHMVKYLESLNMHVLNIHTDPIDDLKHGHVFHGLNMTIKAIKTGGMPTHFQKLSTQEIFSEIYEKGLWGKSENPEDRYYSGSGSRDKNITNIYLNNVSAFLKNTPTKPNVVDLGCGDFSVGSQLRTYCDNYIACDIVSQLIEHNKKKYADLNVDFRVLNLITDQLPVADIVFVRQVLQHLSNEQIQKLIPKLHQNYSFLILTEHLPLLNSFIPNLDKPAGPDIRLNEYNSGIVLTAPPFNLKPLKEHIICEVVLSNSVIRTILYKLK